MPGGIPTATFAIGPSAAPKNAALFARRPSSALNDPALATSVSITFRQAQTDEVLNHPDPRDPVLALVLAIQLTRGAPSRTVALAFAVAFALLLLLL